MRFHIEPVIARLDRATQYSAAHANRLNTLEYWMPRFRVA
jgi:hypothetical protein